jgi:class III poly(R)-hydroxyalkanoic acid synthase PhaE subunit
MDNNDSKTGQDTASMDWNKVMQEYWLPLTKTWGGAFQPFEIDGHEQLSKGRAADSIQATARIWQTIMGAMSEPGAFEHLQKATEMTPDIALGFTQTCMQSFTNLQTQAGEWIQKRGTSLSTADLQQLDSELIKDLTETYEKEFSRYFKVPQVGLNRISQERSLNAVDKHNSYQLALAEFLHMLYLPVEKSLKSLQEKMADMGKEGPLDAKAKTYYDLWIKLLEGHYMELFKQPEYKETMGKTLFALTESVGARQTVVNDALKQVNIPTNQDLDELSKEIYLLKKRIRALEKK